MPYSAASSPNSLPLCRSADAPRVRVAQKRDTRRLVARADEGGVGRLGETKEEGGGRREETWRSLTSSVSRRGAVTIREEAERGRRAMFPIDFRGSRVGNERGTGWNSGGSDGIRAKF
jgi:hypothetical protein